MTYNFATISTESHLHKVFVLYESLYEIDKDVCLHVLITDVDDVGSIESPFDNVIFYTPHDCCKDNLSQSILKKYNANADKLRWTMKPVFLLYLLREIMLQKVIYVDNDIAFFGAFNFLFKELSNYNVLLTPHNYSRDPLENQNWLEANFRVGLYNAGFVAVNKNAISAIEWWAGCCLYRCQKNYMRGLFDDQKYLDLIPIIEPKTKVLEHKGCNLAGWNLDICRRGEHNGKVLINGQWPVVFIHFNPTTLQCFYEDKDPHLMPCFNSYSEMLKKYNVDSDLKQEAFKETYIQKIKLLIWRLLNRINTVNS
ncbi:MAG: hypothetical protein WD048_17280 [Chitinophagales bacterium]